MQLYIISLLQMTQCPSVVEVAVGVAVGVVAAVDSDHLPHQHKSQILVCIMYNHVFVNLYLN